MTTVELLGFVPDPGLGPEPVAVRELARVFERHGVGVRGWRAVAPEEALAERALAEAAAGGGLVVCLGVGEGAAVARQALAHLTGSRLVLSDAVLEAVAASYGRQGRAMPRRAEGLALIPQGVTLLAAGDASEPGLLAEVAGAVVAVLPADPRLATALAREYLLPRLPRRGTEPVTVVRTLRLVGLDRSDAEARVASALRGAQAGARLLDADGEVWVRLELRGPTSPAAERRLAELQPALREALGVAWYGDDDETLAGVVGRLLTARRLTVALAESCTGGLLGHRLTDVAGSSAYFERGFVVYSNAAKRELLGVPEAVLTRHGAVSAPCAEAMARGAREQAGTDLGLSVTGIAGPDGGTPTKPVGTVFIGLADARSATVEHHRFPGDREGNKALSAIRALDLLRRYGLGAP
jgi:nicotinamide-nucleotide amidase